MPESSTEHDAFQALIDFDNAPNIFLPEDLALVANSRRMIYFCAYRELAPIMGEQVVAFPPPEDDFKVRFANYLERNRERLYEQICVKFDYCRKRREYASRGRLFAFLIALAVLLFDLKTGGLATAMWVVTTGELDRFCGCAEAQAQTVPR